MNGPRDLFIDILYIYELCLYSQLFNILCISNTRLKLFYYYYYYYRFVNILLNYIIDWIYYLTLSYTCIFSRSVLFPTYLTIFLTTRLIDWVELIRWFFCSMFFYIGQYIAFVRNLIRVIFFALLLLLLVLLKYSPNLWSNYYVVFLRYFFWNVIISWVRVLKYAMRCDIRNWALIIC